MLKSKKSVFIVIGAILLIGGIVCAVIFLNDPIKRTNNPSELLSLGQKYLLEQDYERAIVAFEKLIRIDPKNVEGYLGLADAYIGNGNRDKAVEVLLIGWNETEDGRIAQKIYEFTGEYPPGYSPPGELTADNNNDENGELIDDSTPTYIEIPNDTDDEANDGIDLDGNDDSDEANIEEDESAVAEVEPEEAEEELAWNPAATELDLFSQRLSSNDITDLSRVTGLTYLNLNDNRITGLSALSGNTRLSRLYLDDNQITNVSALRGLTGLTILSLNNNQITDVSALSGLTNLKFLWLEGNYITDVSSLKSLVNLQELYLSGNSISQSSIDELKAELPNCNIRLDTN